MNVCIECKYHDHVNNTGEEDNWCRHKNARSFISGEPQRAYLARTEENLCGREGKLFSPIVDNCISQ